jgi:hypothetical protein
MVKGLKKGLIGLFAVLLALPILNVNVVAAEAQGSEASAHDNVATSVSQALIEQADKYVTIEDNKFVYVENPELSAVEAAEVQAMIAETNANVSAAAQEDGFVLIEEGDYLSLTEEMPVVDTFGYGVTGVQFYWFGVRIFLNAGDIQWGCRVGVGALATYVGSLSGVGYPVAFSIAGEVMKRACGAIGHGFVIDFNFSGGYIGLRRQ